MAARRGSRLLLEHCSRLERIGTERRPSARERLEAALGSELARVLLAGLTGDHRPPPRLVFLP